MENALLRQNGADHERAQYDGRHRTPADALEMVHHRRQPHPRREGDGAERSRRERAEHLHQQHQRPADFGDAAANGIQRQQNAVRRGVPRRRRLVDQPQLLDQAAINFGQAGDASGQAAEQKCPLEALDQPSAECVQPLQPGEVNIDTARADMAPRRLVDDLFKLGGALRRPGTRSHQGQTFAVGLGSERDSAHGPKPDDRAAARHP